MIDTHVHFTQRTWLDALWSPDLRRTSALWPRLQLQAALLAAPDAIAPALASRGIQHAMLMPELSVAPGPQISGGAAAALALTRQMNDATAALVARDPHRFAGLAVINPFGDQRDLAELRRATVALGLRGVAVGTSYHGQGVDHPTARPFLALVADLGLPLILHPTVDGPYNTPRDFGLDLLVGIPAGALAAIVRLLAAGIIEEYPTLRIVILHLGMGLGALLPWLDANTPSAHRRFTDRALSLYADTATASPGALRLALESFGPDHLLFGSDWPLSASANPNDPYGDPAATLSHLPIGPAGRTAIATTNALRLFDLHW